MYDQNNNKLVVLKGSFLYLYDIVNSSNSISYIKVNFFDILANLNTYLMATFYSV